MADTHIENLTKHIYTEAKETFDDLKNGEIDTSNIINIATGLMSIVEKYPNLKGKDKKQIVITVLQELVDDIVKDDTLAMTLNIIIENTMSVVIDRIIDASKGKLKLGTFLHKLYKWKSMLKCCN